MLPTMSLQHGLQICKQGRAWAIGWMNYLHILRVMLVGQYCYIHFPLWMSNCGNREKHDDVIQYHWSVKCCRYWVNAYLCHSWFLNNDGILMKHAPQAVHSWNCWSWHDAWDWYVLSEKSVVGTYYIFCYQMLSDCRSNLVSRCVVANMFYKQIVQCSCIEANAPGS